MQYRRKNPVAEGRRWLPPADESQELVAWLDWIPAAAVVLNNDLLISLDTGILSVSPGEWVLKTAEDELLVLSDAHFLDAYVEVDVA